MLNLNQELVATTLDGQQLQANCHINLLETNKNNLIMKEKFNNSNNKKINAKLRLIKNSKKEIFYLEGQNAKAILALKKVKNKGLRTLEAISQGLPRISSYIHLLRHKKNINILTIREENRKGRYVLLDKIEVLKTNDSNFTEVKNA